MNLRRLRTHLIVIACLAIFPAAWLASQPAYVHRSRLDPTEPLYTSNYLQARGYLLPWLVTEIPPELAPVPLGTRVFPTNLGILYLLALIPATLFWTLVAFMWWLWRKLGTGSADEQSLEGNERKE